MNTAASDMRDRMIRTAKQSFFDGKSDTLYVVENCKWFIERIDAIVILTRDIGYHTSGWWKNPDYERCWHMSISFPGGRNVNKTDWLLNVIFGNYRTFMWCEPPYSKTGKENEVYHYRLFCDENWNPIKPRGEVYSKQFTELGWKSFSELHNK